MAASSSSSSETTRAIVLMYSYVLLWIVLSCLLILYNKYILDPRLFNWPFPISLTMIHMAFCSVVAFIAIHVFNVVELPAEMTPERYMTSVVPIGALYSLSLWFSNSAYLFLSVSFIQMLKAIMPVAVYLVGLAVSKDPFSGKTMSNMLLITVGVAIAAYGEASFVPAGVAFQLAAVVVEALRIVLIQVLLTSEGIKLNPMTTLYYVSPTCLVFLLIPWYPAEMDRLLEAQATFFTTTSMLTLLGNCVVAFALNLAVFLLIGKTSALTMNVAGVVKDWMLIAISWSVIHDAVTVINLLGYLLAFGGVCWYNNAKLQEMKKPAAPKPQVQLTTDRNEEEGLLKGPAGDQN